MMTRNQIVEIYKVEKYYNKAFVEGYDLSKRKIGKLRLTLRERGKLCEIKVFFFVLA